MAKVHNHPSKESHRDPDDSEGNGEDGEDLFDVPEVHREIEKRRFDGGLPPTPELYARAREQWYRLPGSLVRPSMDPVVDDAAPGEQLPPEHTQRGEKGGGL